MISLTCGGPAISRLCHVCKFPRKKQKKQTNNPICSLYIRYGANRCFISVRENCSEFKLSPESFELNSPIYPSSVAGSWLWGVQESPPTPTPTRLGCRLINLSSSLFCCSPAGSPHHAGLSLVVPFLLFLFALTFGELYAEKKGGSSPTPTHSIFVSYIFPPMLLVG